MKAAVCRVFGEAFGLEEIVLAEAGAGEVRIGMKACAICHSDISYADGIWGGELPAIYGHEGSGIVEAVGAGVTVVKPGDRVIATLIRECGSCYYCSQDKGILCEEVFPLSDRPVVTTPSGETLLPAMNMGGFAESVLVHESQVTLMPDDLAFDIASLLACGVLTGWGAVKHASGMVSGQNVVVIGCGGVGLNAVQAAAHFGAGKVIAMDLSADKLGLVEGFGATHAINPTDADVVDQVMALTDNRGADIVFVTVGALSAIEMANSLITKAGKVVIVGMPASGAMGTYEAATLAAWGQQIIGTKMGNAKQRIDIPELIGLYQTGKLKLDELISGRFKLDQINQAMAQVRDGSAIKNVIVFD